MNNIGGFNKEVSRIYEGREQSVETTPFGRGEVIIYQREKHLLDEARAAITEICLEPRTLNSGLGSPKEMSLEYRPNILHTNEVGDSSLWLHSFWERQNKRLL